MPICYVNPTGNLVKGHVLDCAVGPLVERLRDYDSQLYVVWAPDKLRGFGCWEVRRQPDLKTARYSQPAVINPKGVKVREAVQGDVFEMEGYTILTPKYHEQGLVHHIIDAAFLNYDLIRKIKDMDMWEKKDMGFKAKNLNKVIEYNEAKADEALDEKTSREMEYNLKQMKSEMRWFKEYVGRGENPYRLLDHWK